jgi:hypothetical protein
MKRKQSTLAATAATTTDTFNSSKIYSLFSLLWDYSSCTQQKNKENMTK